MCARHSWNMLLLWCACAAWAIVPAGCDGAAGTGPAMPAGTGTQAGSGHDDDHHHHAHGEKGPHGGALVALGGHSAHLEIVLDAASGKVTAYVLDGDAANPMTIQMEKLEFTFTKEHAHEGDEKKKPADALPEAAMLTLLAVDAAEGATSQFAGESADLKGADEFDAVLLAITVNGKEFKDVNFEYPKGNEHLAH